MTQTLALIHQVTQLFNVTHESIQNISNSTQACWLCLRLTCRAYIGTPVPSYRNSTRTVKGNNQTELIGPVVYNIQFLLNAGNITFLTDPGVGNISCGSVPAQLCSKNQTTNQSETYCASPRSFLLCRSTIFRCLQVNWTGLCMLVFLTTTTSHPTCLSSLTKKLSGPLTPFQRYKSRHL